MTRAEIRATILLGTAVAAMLLPPVGRATGGRSAFAGGTPREQEEVTRAVDASSFDWSVVFRGVVQRLLGARGVR